VVEAQRQIGFVVPRSLSRVGLTTLRFSCGRNARRSEFYRPLSATGRPYLAELGPRRARQLQPLVRPQARMPQRPLAGPSAHKHGIQHGFDLILVRLASGTGGAADLTVLHQHIPARRAHSELPGRAVGTDQFR